jgi:hypothetical protein
VILAGRQQANERVVVRVTFGSHCSFDYCVKAKAKSGNGECRELRFTALVRGSLSTAISKPLDDVD